MGCGSQSFSHGSLRKAERLNLLSVTPNDLLTNDQDLFMPVKNLSALIQNFCRDIVFSHVHHLQVLLQCHV